jgi:seryl-tRNA synthetase
MTADTNAVAGLSSRDDGHAVLSGPLLAASRRLDALFLKWAARWNAEEWRFPAVLPASQLDRLDYFRSFPHLVTFPVVLDDAPDNLERLASGPALGDDGAVRLPATAPVRDVLTPAACYHFYVELAGARLDRARYLTTVASCFRREKFYRPLFRQWNFTMREVVCIGTLEEVASFLSSFRELLTRYFTAAQLPVAWEEAADPFFGGAANPKFIAQMVDPVKTEMVFSGELAIGSINSHRSFFGETFGINRGDSPAFSGCVAFGLERWLYALLVRFGPDPQQWPAALWEPA